jgi:hypothetical protein
MDLPDADFHAGVNFALTRFSEVRYTQAIPKITHLGDTPMPLPPHTLDAIVSRGGGLTPFFPPTH